MKISIAKFNELMNISPIIGDDDKEAKKELKFKLLDHVQEALADKWYNLKKATKEALQYACMRSTELGFFFCSPSHIAKKFGISVSALYTLLRELLDTNVMYKVNRTSTKHNGNGNAVYIFVNHPNFSTICDILNLNWKTNEKSDCKTESAEIPCDCKVDSDNSTPTLFLPTNLQNIKDNVKHSNVEDDTDKLLRRKIEEAEKRLAEQPYEPKTPKFIKYVPKEINEKFGYFGSLLVDLWRKIKLAERKVNNQFMTKEIKIELACEVIQNLRKNSRFKEMSVDEMCAYVYKAHLNAMFHYLGELNISEAMSIDEKHEYYAYVIQVDGRIEHVLTNSENEVFEEEEFKFEGKIYNWLEEDNTENYYVEEAYQERPSLDNFPF